MQNYKRKWVQKSNEESFSDTRSDNPSYDYWGCFFLFLGNGREVRRYFSCNIRD